MERLLLLLVPAASLASVGDTLWIEDFSSSSLDLNTWSYDTGFGVDGWGNQELQEYTDSTENVKLENRRLNIIARRNAGGTGFTSGRIKTDGKVEFAYGRLEAMILVPDVADGLWPAFWTLGNNFNQVGWPRAGEIDIMEIGQGLAITEGKVNQRVISGAHWENDESYATYALGLDIQGNLFAGFRNYTLDWTPSRMITYVDGQKIWEIDISAASCTDCEEFHRPHFMLLNLAVGGLFTSVGGSGSSSSSGVGSSSSAGCAVSSSAAGSSSSAGGCGQARTDVTAPLPATMVVDYIRLIDNGFTVNFTFPFLPTNAPVAAPTAPPQIRPSPRPTPRPTQPPPTPAPQLPPTPAPQLPPTPAPQLPPTPAPQLPQTPVPVETRTPAPVVYPPPPVTTPSLPVDTPAPILGSPTSSPALTPSDLLPAPSLQPDGPDIIDSDDDDDEFFDDDDEDRDFDLCERSSRSGKGKGKGSSSRSGIIRSRSSRSRIIGDILCDEGNGKGGKGKGGKGKGGQSRSSKSSKSSSSRDGFLSRSSELSAIQSFESVPETSPAPSSLRGILPVAVALWMLTAVVAGY